ncbi:MAG: methionine adenosyltransferase domain-containing protein [bacterium]|nr:methionine adenosyltransferase domain-containing protein [bacterium]
MKTAESVTPMHPDKLCDRISDAILDACLRQDPTSRVAVETMGGHGIITITGELTTSAYINARDIVHKIVGTQYGVQTNIVSQSPEIAGGVDMGGAGDQGIMVGYACNDNEAMIPQELFLARSLCKAIYDKYPFDGKTQTTLNHDGSINTIIASFQNVSRADVVKEIEDWLKKSNRDVSGITMHANPAGDWSQGGFEADTGVTGRKLAVDNYGPQIPIGGGAFSGKDATKVDRSGAYMARKIAVDCLKKNNAKAVIVKLAYAIGVAEPVQAIAVVDGVSEVVEGYDLTPKGIIDFLELRKPQFEQTAMWGHFGHGFLWER